MSIVDSVRVLLIEDNAGNASSLRDSLREPALASYEMTCCESMTAARAHLATHQADVILLDLGLPDAANLDAVRQAHAAAPRVPILVVTDLDNDALALQSLREGADDFLIKGEISPGALARAMRHAIERKTMAEAVLAESEMAYGTLHCLGDAVVSTNIDGKITFINLAAEALTNWSRREATGRSRDDVLALFDAAGSVPASIPAPSVDGDGHVRQLSDLLLQRRGGDEVPVEGSIAAIRDRDGHRAGEVIVFRDVSAARAMSERMAHSAEHDFLTGLPNRMLLNDRVSRAISIAPRHHKKVAILFLDLDGFKFINDSLGHLIGDKLLQSVASRLVDCVRVSDTVSRQGGDEFVVLLSEVELAEDAAATARRMLDAVSEMHRIDGHELHVTTSVGIAIYPDDGLDAETLVKHADTAMYQAKDAGRHGYQFFRPAMNARAAERQSTEDSLRAAMERFEFTLHYQPKINLRTGRIAGAEALVRWSHPTRGPLSPAEFIPIAEASGLIQKIGTWVLREACTQARAWIASGLNLPRIAVNISAMEFRREQFIEGVFAVLEETGLDPTLLELELTERVLMQEVEATEAVLRALRDKGIKIAVDDFGTGFSSLNNLQKFPIDTLKIDRSFVRQIGAAGENTSIVIAVLNMARGLDLRVVAEGVETSQELAFLQHHECDVGQGYYFSRPLPSQQFATLLRSGILPTMAARRLQMAAPVAWAR